MANEFLEAALAYRALGWSVIPVGREKRCVLNSWAEYQKRIPTEEEIREWWAQFPSANVALVTGQVSGVVVFDLDSPESREIFIAEWGKLPLTVSQRTGRPGGAGMHLIFQHPGKQCPNIVGFRHGIDVRGDGGYAILPPSVHESGNSYAWEIDPRDSYHGEFDNCGNAAGCDDILPLPDELLAALTSHYARGNGNGLAAKAEAAEHPTWVNEALKGVGESKRNDTLARLTGYFINRFKGNLDVVISIMEMWNERCTPPLTYKELITSIKSIIKTAEKKKENELLGLRTESGIESIVVQHYPDGDVRYLVYVASSDLPASMDADDLSCHRRFRVGMLKLTTQLAPSMKDEKWVPLINSLLSEAKHVTMHADETKIGSVVRIIEAAVNSPNVPDKAEPFINTRFVVKDDKIIFKLETLLNQLKYDSNEKINRKELSAILRQLGFEFKQDRHISETNSKYRYWTIGVDKWDARDLDEIFNPPKRILLDKQ